MNLVYMDGKREPYTLSSIVAECTGLQHHTITKTIRKHYQRFERLGKVGFKIQALESGQHSKDYLLNEQQATLFVTFLKNTEQVANFKENLVKAFFEMRDELAQIKLQRTLEQPKRKSLHKAIEHWENAPKHAHSTVNNLLLKGASGMNKRQLMVARNGHNGIDSLTSDELIRYQSLENMAIAMINLDMTYQEIKTIVFRKQTQGG